MKTSASPSPILDSCRRLGALNLIADTRKLTLCRWPPRRNSVLAAGNAGFPAAMAIPGGCQSAVAPASCGTFTRLALSLWAGGLLAPPTLTSWFWSGAAATAGGLGLPLRLSAGIALLAGSRQPQPPSGRIPNRHAVSRRCPTPHDDAPEPEARRCPRR